jgi:hypothetical protein
MDIERQWLTQHIYAYNLKKEIEYQSTYPWLIWRIKSSTLRVFKKIPITIYGEDFIKTHCLVSL